jgi:hypothetical protein
MFVAASAKAAAAAVEVQKLKAGLEDGLKKDIQDYVTQAALDHDALVNQHAQSLLPLCENMEEATFVVGECSKIKQMREAIYRPERAYSLEGKIKALLARSINE